MANFRKIETIETCSHTVLPDRPLLVGQKLLGNAKIKKIQMGIFQLFSNNMIIGPNRKLVKIDFSYLGKIG